MIPIPVARTGDQTIGICYCCKGAPLRFGVIISGSPNTFMNALPSSRVADQVMALPCCHPGIIVSGSPFVTANALPVARVSDQTVGCYNATIISGAAGITA